MIMTASPSSRSIPFPLTSPSFRLDGVDSDVDKPPDGFRSGRLIGLFVAPLVKAIERCRVDAQFKSPVIFSH
jgi:hypothetical protein